MQLKYSDKIAHLLLGEAQTLLLFIIRLLTGKSVFKYSKNPNFESFNNLNSMIKQMLVFQI